MERFERICGTGQRSNNAGTLPLGHFPILALKLSPHSCTDLQRGPAKQQPVVRGDLLQLPDQTAVAVLEAVALVHDQVPVRDEGRQQTG